MSEIGLTITPNVATTQIVIDQNTIQITPDTISLGVYTQGAPVAGGNNGQLQYNNLNTLGGVPNTSVANGNLTFQNLPNLKISGGSNSYFLQTDGTGNLTWATGTVSSNGNGSANGANTQIQMTDGAGNFVGAAGFTFNYISNALAVPGDGVFVGNVTANYFIGNIVGNISNANYATYAGNVVDNSQPNITSVGTLNALSVNNFITATQFVSNIATGTAPLSVQSTSKVANLNVDLLDGYDSSIPAVANTVVVRDANGSINANVVAANTVTGNFIGNISGVTSNNIALGYQAGQTAQASHSIAIGSNAATNTQGNLSIAIGVNAASNTQGNSSIAIGVNAASNSQGFGAIAIGNSAGKTQQANGAISIGIGTGANNQGYTAIAIGQFAGENQQGNYSLGIGDSSGRQNQGSNSVAIGYQASQNNQGNLSVALGAYAGMGSNALGHNQANYTIAIGAQAAESTNGDQEIGAIAIGYQAARAFQRQYSIAIGYQAGANIVATNSIILNATGTNVNSNVANSFIVKPIRNATSGNILYYDANLGEITYGSGGGGGGNAAGSTGEIQYNSANILAASPNLKFYSGNYTFATDNMILSGNANITGTANVGSLSTSGFGGITAWSVTANTNITGNIIIGNLSNISGNVTAGNVTANVIVRTINVTFATLPTAANAGAGARAFISDANNNTFRNIVAGGGTNALPIFSDGTNWRIG